MPVSAVFENLRAGSDIEEIIEQFRVTREQIQAVLRFAARGAESGFAPPSSAVGGDMDEKKMREAAIDVAYECKMFREACNRYLSDHPTVTVSPTLGHTVTENPTLGHNDSTAGIRLTAFATTPAQLPRYTKYLDRDALLIHFRVLIDFFYKGDEQDDVRAHHYTGGAPRQRPAWCADFERKCNKLFAHLTYRRTEYRDLDRHHWHELPQHASEMNAELARFLASLDANQRAWFQVADC